MSSHSGISLTRSAVGNAMESTDRVAPLMALSERASSNRAARTDHDAIDILEDDSARTTDVAAAARG